MFSYKFNVFLQKVSILHLLVVSYRPILEAV